MRKVYYPKIKFTVDLKREKQFFLNRKRNLQKFLPAGLSFVLKPEFKSKKNAILSAYLDAYYSEQRKNLVSSVNNTRLKWSKVEKIYFKKVDNLFHNWPWSKGNYQAYISIARSFPRNIEKKYFAFPVQSYKPGRENQDIRVIAHEMLHFIEYDYLQNKFGLTPSESNSKDNTFWQFTENLNVLIENSNFWREFSAGCKSKPYPDCEKLYNRMKKIWDKNKDVDKLIRSEFGEER